MMESDGHLISVRQKDSMFLLDLTSKTALKAISYSNLIYLEHSLWAGKMKDGYTLLNDMGQPVTDKRYQQINKFSEGFAAFSQGDFWGYMDEKGNSAYQFIESAISKLFVTRTTWCGVDHWPLELSF